MFTNFLYNFDKQVSFIPKYQNVLILNNNIKTSRVSQHVEKNLKTDGRVIENENKLKNKP